MRALLAALLLSATPACAGTITVQVGQHMPFTHGHQIPGDPNDYNTPDAPFISFYSAPDWFVLDRDAGSWGDKWNFALVYDAAALPATPEPSTWALLATGFVALGFIGRKSRVSS